MKRTLRVERMHGCFLMGALIDSSPALKPSVPPVVLHLPQIWLLYAIWGKHITDFEQGIERAFAEIGKAFLPAMQRFGEGMAEVLKNNATSIPNIHL